MSVATVTTMARSRRHFDQGKAPLRGVCLLVKPSPRLSGPAESFPTGGYKTSFPHRPNPQMLSETIPLYFIARNKNGFWIAREAEGRTGGIFVFQRSALRFAKKTSAPNGCATMFLPQRLELDVPNRGVKITALLNVIVEWLGNLIPDHPPAIRIRHEIFARGNK